MYMTILAAVLVCGSETGDTGPATAEVHKFQGSWKCIECQRLGEPDQATVGVRINVRENAIDFLFAKGTETCWFELLPGYTSPKQLVWKQVWEKGIDFNIEFAGIYSISDDVLVLCLPQKSTGERPAVFASSREAGTTLMVFERMREVRTDKK